MSLLVRVKQSNRESTVVRLSWLHEDSYSFSSINSKTKSFLFVQAMNRNTTE